MIHFFSEDTDLPDINQSILAGWIKEVITSHNKMAGEINYIFCSDEQILSVNKEFLKHDYYTDIITFDYSQSDVLSGDIYISLDTVSSNAIQLGITYENEVNRVIVHGVLHLCGFKDKMSDESIQMRKLEDNALKLLYKNPIINELHI